MNLRGGGDIKSLAIIPLSELDETHLLNILMNILMNILKHISWPIQARF